MTYHNIKYNLFPKTYYFSWCDDGGNVTDIRTRSIVLNDSQNSKCLHVIRRRLIIQMEGLVGTYIKGEDIADIEIFLSEVANVLYQRRKQERFFIRKIVYTLQSTLVNQNSFLPSQSNSTYFALGRWDFQLHWDETFVPVNCRLL